MTNLPAASPCGNAASDRLISVRRRLEDTFKGGDTQLLEAIAILLDLDAAGSLVPHGIGGHAKTLLNSAGLRLLNAQEVLGRTRTRLRALQPALNVMASEVLDDIIAETGGDR